jgi:arylsulfatase A
MRRFLILLAACAVGVLLLAAPALAASRDATNHPNVVLVFLDDAGYADLAHTGHPAVRTPTISRLVNEGVNFTQFYAQPACTASRYALLTGRNPRRSGLGTWVLDPTSMKFIHPNEVTIADGLKAQGYATGMFGKWHLGEPNTSNTNSPNTLPLAHGFQRYFGTSVSHDYATGCYLLDSPNTNAPQYVVPGYQVLGANQTADTTLTRRYVDASLAFIETNKAQPFFLYLAFNMPHLSLNPGAAFAGTSPAGKLGDVLEEMDDGIGRIMSALQGDGIATNTLVILTSDNGPWILHYTDDQRLDAGYAGPFRDGKGSTWEGGVRELACMWWPGVISPGTVQRQPASTMDVLPTVFALAGQPLPTGRTLDGRDLRPYLNPALWTNTVPEFTHIYAGGVNFSTLYGARKGPWKLHTTIYSQTGNNYGYSNVSWNNPLLFHVEYDPGERSNQAASQAAKVVELKTLINTFSNSVATEQTFWGAP